MPNRFPDDVPSQTRRGGKYDSRHATQRRRSAAQHSEADPCTRCAQPLGPMGPWLHLDHTDDGTGYLGFAHADCNRRAGARLGNQRQRDSTGYTRKPTSYPIMPERDQPAPQRSTRVW